MPTNSIPTDQEQEPQAPDAPAYEVDPAFADMASELGITQNPDGSFELPDVAPDDSGARLENSTGAAGMVAPLTGGLKATFETKDFLFGDTPPEEQSTARRLVEEADSAIKQESPILGGLASGIGQFTVAMVGLGKVGSVARMLPWVGNAATTVQGVKGGTAALEAGKAAMAGAIAFDPHEERLSNLIQDTPLANPFTEWLSAKPEDTAAMGRLKAAMESLGMDAAIIGTFTGGLKIWKYLKQGKMAEASRAVSQLEAQQRAAMEGSAPDVAAQTAGPQDGPEAISGSDGAGLPPLPDDPSGTGLDVPGTPEAAPAAGALPAQGTDISGAGGELAQGSDQLEVGGQPATPTAAGGQDVTVDITANPTSAMAEEGITPPGKLKPVVDFQPDAAASLLDDIPMTLENAEKDWNTMTQYGQWSGAMENSQNLGPDMGTFYDRFKTDAELDNYIDLAVNHKAEELTSKGFRVRLSDETLQLQVQAFASMAGVDPAGLLGTLQAAGEASRTLTAKMIVVGSLTAKAFQDASLMAMRRKIGDYTTFGSLEAMEAEIAKRFSLATTLLKITDEIRSQGGRTLRANRGRPFDPSMFEGVSKDRFYDLLAEAQGSPEKLKMLADPTLYTKIMDTVQYMRIGSMLSGPKTQLINLVSSGYMVAARPMERILGSIPGAVAGNAGSRAIIKENLKQYSYLGTAFMDGFGQAVKAFTRNDGLLRPHGTEVNVNQGSAWVVPGAQAMGPGYFKPWDSLPNILYNAFSIPLTAAGTPVRMLGGVDELVKQTVYRSKLMARAHMEGVEQALEAGLDGANYKAFVQNYVKKQLDNAFDAEGRGLDPQALREANIASLQQDLLPGTLGRNVQSLISNDKTRLSRFILPFVKTPTNALRYGWKMTPALNMLQTEYKQMISGKLGQEAKAQALGQMTMGALFMGSATYLAAQGMVTGGGPSDPKLKSQLLATGWQPYSIVVKNDDGTTRYIPFNRYDPVALPFGIIADVQDAIHIWDDDASPEPEIENAIGALLTSLSKQFTSRTYLLSLNQALEALTDPDHSGGRFVGGLMQSAVPFSGFTRQMSTDPYLRDARDVADRMMQVIPGMSKNLPPRYNWLGQPVLNRQGLWSDDNGTLVDTETIRLGLEGGSTMNPPSPILSFGNNIKIDLRDIITESGRNGYEVYQELSGKPAPNARSLRDAVADLMRTPAYQRAPDGEVGTRGTKLWLIAGRVEKYRQAAGKRIRADKNVREALMKAQRKVIDHYKHLKEAPATGQQQGTLGNVLSGFGADR